MICIPPAWLLAAGATSVVAGASRPIDFCLKPLGFALIGASLMLGATPAWADQHRQAADNARVDCAVSSRDLTRIALVGDGFASVSKVSTGYPFNDFTVTNEPIRGDIYSATLFSSSPDTYAAIERRMAAGDTIEQAIDAVAFPDRMAPSNTAGAQHERA